MRAGEVCNREVVIARVDESIVDAARLMREHQVGELVIVRAVGEQNIPVAVLTDRDLVVEVLAQVPERAAELSIGDVIGTTELVTITEATPVSEIVEVMKKQRVRRVPVVSRTGGLVGIVTYDDLLDLIGTQLADLASVDPKPGPQTGRGVRFSGK